MPTKLPEWMQLVWGSYVTTQQKHHWPWWLWWQQAGLSSPPNQQCHLICPLPTSLHLQQQKDHPSSPDSATFWAYSIFCNSGTKNHCSSTPQIKSTTGPWSSHPNNHEIPTRLTCNHLWTSHHQHLPISHHYQQNSISHTAATNTSQAWQHNTTHWQAHNHAIQICKKDPLSFTINVGTALNPHSNMTHLHTHPHHNHLPPPTMPQPYSHLFLHNQTMLTSPYKHPITKDSNHPHPRYDTTTTIQC